LTAEGMDRKKIILYRLHFSGVKNPGKFVHIAGLEKKSKGSLFHWDEIAVVQTIVDLLRSTDELSVSELRVVLPYKAQSMRLCEQLHNRFEVCTVDGFQGHENEVVLGSIVQSGSTCLPL
jgi:superfamily I DNA and/or RNA helicase